MCPALGFHNAYCCLLLIVAVHFIGILIIYSFSLTEKLPEVTKSLRPFGANEDKSLSEFQVELIQLASQINGDHVLNTYPDIGKTMTVVEANRYAEDAVARFLEAGRIALRAGANESALVTMRPALTSRAAMSSSLTSEL
jgi:phospholipase C